MENQSFTASEYEGFDRTVVSNAIKNWDSSTSYPNLTIQSTTLFCPVDLKVYNWVNGTKTLNIEIKTQNGNYPSFLLKKEKLERMRREAGNGDLWYVVINPDTSTIYWYDCKSLDWSKIYCKDLYQKVSNTRNLGYASYETYYIPRNLTFTTTKYAYNS